MSIDNRRANLAGPVPPGGLPTTGNTAMAELTTESAGGGSALLMRELRSIDQQVSDIKRMRGTDSNAEELVAKCVHVWSRIKQLHDQLSLSGR